MSLPPDDYELDREYEPAARPQLVRVPCTWCSGEGCGCCNGHGYWVVEQ